jgi:outer membrane protein TolC
MTFIRITIVLLFGITTTSASGQEILSKESAVRLVLEQNYDILRAMTNVEIAMNNTDKGAIGYNPVINANANGGLEYGNSYQEFSTGQEVRGKNVTTASGNASVILDYNFYEGGRRDLTLEQMLETVKLTELQQRMQAETSILQLMVAYYQVANLTNTVNSLEETLEVSKRRLDRAQYQFEYGQGNKLAVLNAEVDINRDSVNLRDARQLLSNAKRDVNVILARQVDTDFEVDTTLNFTPGLDLEQMLIYGADTNAQVLLARQNLRLTEYDRELIETGARPVIGGSVSLGGNISKNLTSESFINYSTRWGPSLNVGMAWNLWDGGLRDVQRQNVQIQLENQQLSLDQLQVQLERDIRNAWEVYENSLFVLGIEERNLKSNIDNFERTQEQFNIGQVTSVEFRQAQFNLVNARINLSTARYTAKVAELRLLQLCGQILDARY